MASSQKPEAGNSPMRVLVVDDNSHAAKALTWVMQAQGCDVVTAYDGPTAIVLTTSFKPQLILLDVGMPGMDGLETCRRLRSLRSIRQPMIIAQTGWGEIDMRRKTREAGFDLHVTKPINYPRFFAYLGWTGTFGPARRPDLAPVEAFHPTVVESFEDYPFH